MRLAASASSNRSFLLVSAVIFAVSTTVTIALCTPVSTIVMCAPGRTWFSELAAFLGMWVVMMVAMMLPSLTPMLLRYRQVVGHEAKLQRVRLTLLVAFGYYFVWTVLGLLAYLIGVTLSAIETRLPAIAHAATFLAGMVVLFAGLLQFSKWKAHHLDGSRMLPGCDHRRLTDAVIALQYGLRLGLHCSYCCSGLMAILLVIGIMDLPAMTVVTLAMTSERLAPNGKRVAQAIGFVCIGAGAMTIARAAGL
ncbi:MAG: DUF2182 domain-containing protein [Gammaproteobacteria bacterium]|nr:DUF2182 domain-containing protein [Gammaproteobacteria bacterium]